MEKKVIQKKAFKGAVWNLMSNIGTRMISLAIQIVLARLIAPQVFGVIAIVAVVDNLALVLVSSGYVTALINKKELNDVDTSSAFYMGLFISVVLYGVVFFTSPAIAAFYGEESLSTLLRVSSISLIINALGSVQKSLISRNLDFHLNFYISLISTFAQGLVGIIMALNGFGVWALVASSLTSVSVNILITCILVKWHPQWLFSFTAVKNMFSYSSKLLLVKLLKSIQLNLSTLIIGKRYDSATLAFYNRGNQIPDIIQTSISGSINSVTLPLLSKYQDNVLDVRNGLRRIISISCVMGAPIKFGLLAIAEPLILFLLTDTWAASIPFMQIACFSLLLGPFAYKQDAYNAIGRTGLSLFVEILHRSIFIVLLFIAMPFGVTAIAISCVVANLIDAFISLIINKKVLFYSFKQQLKDFLPANIIGFFMFIAVFFFGKIALPLWLLLFLQILIGALVYSGISYFFNRNELLYIWNLAKTSLSRTKKS